MTNRELQEAKGNKTGNMSMGRHTNHCSVCKHPQRVEIERDWISWGNTTRIAREYHVSRDSLYRHAHALDLFGKRRRNVRMALEKIIERAEDVQVNASAVVAAIQAYAKINRAGQWIDQAHGTDMHALFNQMTKEELIAYAQDGSLPEWFRGVVGATVNGSPEGQNEK
jgi:hypothetical protein